MTLQKVGFLGPYKVFGDPKCFWAPPKHKKLIFSKNLNSLICLNMGLCFHSGPGHPGTIRPLKTIHLRDAFKKKSLNGGTLSQLGGEGVKINFKMMKMMENSFFQNHFLGKRILFKNLSVWILSIKMLQHNSKQISLVFKGGRGSRIRKMFLLFFPLLLKGGRG